MVLRMGSVYLIILQILAQLTASQDSSIPWDVGDLSDDQMDVDSYFDNNKKIVGFFI